MRGIVPVPERAMDITGWLKRALGIAPPPVATPPPPPRYPPERYLESRFPAPRTRFREEEQERKAAAERWVAEVGEAFGFLCREHGATLRFGEAGTHPWTQMPVATYELPALSIRLTSKPARYSFRVPLADGGRPPEVYEFDLAEMIWYVPTFSSRRGVLPQLHTQRGYEQEPIATVATRLGRYCEAELRGDLSSFREIVAQRRAGATPHPRVPRWCGFTTSMEQPMLRNEVHLPSPDGRYVATMEDAFEMWMSGPIRGTLRLSNGRVVQNCHPHMAWSADSRHLAVLRLDLGKRRTLLAVVRASDGTVRELETERGICFPRLLSFRDGLVSTNDPPPFDVSHLCV